jgi:hypothetical protein
MVAQQVQLDGPNSMATGPGAVQEECLHEPHERDCCIS